MQLLAMGSAGKPRARPQSRRAHPCGRSPLPGAALLVVGVVAMLSTSHSSFMCHPATPVPIHSTQAARPAAWTLGGATTQLAAGSSPQSPRGRATARPALAPDVAAAAFAAAAEASEVALFAACAGILVVGGCCWLLLRPQLPEGEGGNPAKASQPPTDELEAMELTFRDFPLVMVRGLTSPLILAAQRTVVAAGARLITEGEKGQQIFAITAGTCQVLSNGREVNVCGPGSVFGELPLLTSAPHTMSYIALTDMIVYSIEYKHVQLELKRRKGVDPYGLAADVAKHLADRGVSVTTNRKVDRSPEYLWQGRLMKLQTQVRRTPWHGVCGAYIMLSALVACAILPFSPSALPAWWTSSFALASAWVALSGDKPRRRFYFQGLGTGANFDAGIACQLFFAYMIIRCSWDNMGLALPNYLESPWMHAVDIAVAFATVVRVLNWTSVFDPNPGIFLINVGQLITPVWWAAFFLKPAWLSATLDDNITYNLLLAFMIQVGANAGTYFLATLEARGFITTEQDIIGNLFFGLGVADWPVVIAVVCNWPVVFDLLTFKAWLDFPLFGV